MPIFGFRDFDELLAFHCAPVLMGIKPANLISLPQIKEQELKMLLIDYNRQFTAQKIVFRQICSCNQKRLLLIYQAVELGCLLKNKACRNYLASVGYGRYSSLEEDLLTLEKRLQYSCEFPHEIGIFLGYPLEDVLGFVINKGKSCKYSGYWKVYGDVEQAKRVFAVYEKCRDSILQKLADGLPLYKAVITA